MPYLLFGTSTVELVPLEYGASKKASSASVSDRVGAERVVLHEVQRMSGVRVQDAVVDAGVLLRGRQGEDVRAAGGGPASFLLPVLPGAGGHVVRHM